VNEKLRTWRPNSTLAKWLCGVLLVQTMVNVVCVFLHEADRWVAVHNVLENTSVDSSNFNSRLQDAMNTSNSAWFSIAGYALTASLVLYVIWSWRGANNSLALGRTGARQSPGWVIAGWLIPIANLVMPYQTVSDLWRSSGPDVARGAGWRSSRASGRVAWWWVTYLVATAGYAACIVWVLVGDWSADQAEPWFAASRGLLALSSLLGAWIVWDITRRQARQHEADPAPTREQVQAGAPGSGWTPGVATGVVPGVAQAIVRGPNGLPVPGWYADPSAVYEFRYWDGVAWTEHVSRAGVASLAPAAPVAAIEAPGEATHEGPGRVIAPDWFRDPSGRHQWRFWGGDDWTPHVSDDGVHRDDPLTAPAPPPDPEPPVG
jgi:hypothetical protein